MRGTSRSWVSGLVVVALGGLGTTSAGCGGGGGAAATDESTQETAGAEAAAPRPAFTGTLGGQPFEASWAALAWQWPGGWTAILSNRAPEEDAGLPSDATFVELRFGDTRAPTETEPGHPMTPYVTLAPAADGTGNAYEGEASATAVLTGISMTGAFDPDGTTPQTIGTATLDLDASFGADANYASGRLAGRGEIPIVFLGRPHVACAEAQPAPTDFTWTDVPNLRSLPEGAVHGSAYGHAFNPASVYFERRTTNGSQEWSLIMTTQPDLSMRGVEHETLTVSFDRAPRRGRMTRAIASGGGFWQVCVGLGTTSWNADNAYAIELTRWQAGRCTPGETGQPARLGTASGRLIVTYRGFEESQNSWVAGTFTDVPVVTPSCE